VFDQSGWFKRLAAIMVPVLVVLIVLACVLSTRKTKHSRRPAPAAPK
jgi:hypothetical protein